MGKWMRHRAMVVLRGNPLRLDFAYDINAARDVLCARSDIFSGGVL